jgi:UPF0755 protein
MVGAVIAAGVFIYLGVSQALPQPQADSTGQPVMFTVQPGQDVGTIADNLEQAGLLDGISKQWFILKLKGAGPDKLPKAGRFQLTPGMSVDQLIDTLSTPPAEVGIRFTVIEGMRLEQIAEKLSSEGIISSTIFMQMAGTPEGAAKFQSDFLASSGRPADQGLEGYLFPDTYEIKQSDGDNSEAVIRIMLRTMEEKFTPEMRQAVAEKGRTIHQVLTVASIVQREGVVKEELPDIASVFWNRVDAGMPLDADPTTQYALGRTPNWWPNLDQLGVLPRDVDHPYNTYKFPGLPPGPICSPGLDAIRAAVYPSDTNYLYFVAKNDGTGAHAFAETLEEHERNRVIYGNR